MKVYQNHQTKIEKQMGNSTLQKNGFKSKSFQKDEMLQNQKMDVYKMIYFEKMQKKNRNSALQNYCTRMEISFALSPRVHMHKKRNFNT